MGQASFEGSMGRPARAVTPVRVVALVAALLLGGCAQLNSIGLDAETPKVADIATSSAGPRPQSELEKATAYWGEQHAKNPRDAKTALSYARNLKALGRKQQALSVMQASYMFATENREFLSEYGRLALEMDQVSTAGELLARADDPTKPDWRITSARGTVLAKQGNYKGAIGYYEQALQLAPEQASVMNNLAMAYTMDGQADRGEQLLRQARAAQGANVDPRITQNLTLVMGLQGKGGDGGDAGAVAPAVMPAAHTPQPAAAQPAAPLRAAQGDARPAVVKASAIAAPVAAKPATDAVIDPDQIIRAAMEAEQAKTAGAPRR